MSYMIQTNIGDIVELEDDLFEAKEVPASYSTFAVSKESGVKPETQAEADPSLEEVADTDSNNNHPSRPSFMAPPQHKNISDSREARTQRKLLTALRKSRGSKVVCVATDVPSC